MLQSDQEQVLDFLNSLDIIQNPRSGFFSFSDFLLHIKAKEGEKTIQIRFFNGIAKPDGDSALAFEYIDNRIDFLIDGHIYSFESDSNLHLTEEMMIEMFNQGARRSGLPQMWEIDGFSQGIYTRVPYPTDISPGITLPLLEFDPRSTSCLDILSSSDFVASVEYSGPVNGATWGRYYVEGFRIKNVYKDYDEARSKLSKKRVIIDEYLFLENSSRIVQKQNPRSTEYELTKIYPHPCMPDYRVGTTYLLCIDSSFYSEGQIPAISPMRIAIIQDGTLYPCYNSEHHPFYGLTLKDLEACFNQ